MGIGAASWVGNSAGLDSCLGYCTLAATAPVLEEEEEDRNLWGPLDLAASVIAAIAAAADRVSMAAVVVGRWYFVEVVVGSFERWCRTPCSTWLYKAAAAEADVCVCGGR